MVKKKLSGKARNYSLLNERINEIESLYFSLSSYVKLLETKIYKLNGVGTPLIPYEIKEKDLSSYNLQIFKVIVNITCKHYNIKPEDVFRKKIKREVSDIKKTIFYIAKNQYSIKEVNIPRLLKTEYNFSYDRSTVYSAIESFQETVLENFNNQYKHEYNLYLKIKEELELIL